MAAPVKLENGASSASSSSSLYASSSQEAECQHPLIEAQAKEICEEPDDANSLQEILEEVSGSDLKNRKEAVDDKEKDDYEKRRR